MRLLLRFARTYPWQSLLMLTALVFAGVAEGIGLTAILPLLQQALGNGGGAATIDSRVGRIAGEVLRGLGISPTMEALLTLILVGLLLKSLLVLLANRRVGYTVAHVTTDLRLSFLEALLAARWPYFLHQPLGALANAMATEVMRASAAYLYGATSVALLSQALVYLGVALLIDWQITLLYMAAALVFLLAMNFLVRTAKRAGRRQTRLLQSLLARLTDSLQSVKPLKAMGREDLAGELLAADTVRLNRALRKQVFSKAALQGFQDPLLVLLVVAGLYGMLRIWQLDLSRAMVLIFLLARLLNLLGKVQRQYQEMASCESAYWSLQEKMEEARQQREPISGGKKAIFEREIRFAGVDFAYGARKVLEGISLDIPAGCFVTIVGRSGAGKTTLIDLLCGLLRPDAGRILVDGVSLRELEMASWRRLIGYVPQEAVLLHDSILANVTLGDIALESAAVEQALQAAGAWDFVAAAPEGVQTVVGERGARLSGGQRQRIAIARALVHRPRLLILDEATSALDRQSEAEICRTLQALRGRLTIVAIAHQSPLIEAADRVYRIEGGWLVQDPSPLQAKGS